MTFSFNFFHLDSLGFTWPDSNQSNKEQRNQIATCELNKTWTQREPVNSLFAFVLNKGLDKPNPQRIGQSCDRNVDLFQPQPNKDQQHPLLLCVWLVYSRQPTHYGNKELLTSGSLTPQCADSTQVLQQVRILYCGRLWQPPCWGQGSAVAPWVGILSAGPPVASCGSLDPKATSLPAGEGREACCWLKRWAGRGCRAERLGGGQATLAGGGHRQSPFPPSFPNADGHRQGRVSRPMLEPRPRPRGGGSRHGRPCLRLIAGRPKRLCDGLGSIVSAIPREYLGWHPTRAATSAAIGGGRPRQPAASWAVLTGGVGALVGTSSAFAV